VADCYSAVNFAKRAMSLAPAAKRLKRTYSFASAASAASQDVDMVQDRQIAKLKRNVSQLKKAEESKAVFTQIVNAGVSTAGSLVQLDPISEGDGSGNRDGLAIVPSSFEWTLLLESEITDAFNLFQVMIVQAKGGATLTSADFAGVGIPSNPVNLNRYTVLYNRTFLLENNVNAVVAGAIVPQAQYYLSHGKVKVPRKIYFPDAGSVPNSNGLYLWLISDSAVVNHPDVELFHGKLSFTG